MREHNQMDRNNVSKNRKLGFSAKIKKSVAYSQKPMK